MNRSLLVFCAALAFVFGLLLLAPRSARATPIVVSSNADSGVGSLRSAITTANSDGGDDTITFAGSVTTITLTSGELVITAPMTIDGSSGVTLSGNNASSVFEINGSTGSNLITLSGLTIEDSQASDGTFGGGGILNYSDSMLMLTNCTLSDNSAAGEGGGGIANIGGGTVTLTNCTLSGNSASSFGGGGISNYSGSTVTLTNCTLGSNSSSGYEGGGAILNYPNSNVTLTDCTLTNNSVSTTSGDPFGGGAITNVGGGNLLMLTNCTLTNNSAGGNGGGGIFTIGSVVTLTGCTLTNNPSGGIASDGDTLTLSDCLLSGNSAPFGGGGIYTYGTTLKMTDCILTGNSSGQGGGLYDTAGTTATLTGCTLTGNSGEVGGDIYNDQSTLTLDNDILYGDSATVDAPEIYTYASTASATYCDIAGGFSGTGNINQNPLFVSAPANVQLQPGSPCVGAGDPALAGTLDITGATRADPPTIGAYEGVAAGTGTSLSSSQNPSGTGQAVTFTATVTNTSAGSSAIPTGTVAFYLNGSPTPFDTEALSSGAAKAAAQTFTMPGTDSITAIYTPSGGNFTGSSTAKALTQTVIGYPTANPQTVSVGFNTAQAITLTGSDSNSPPQTLTYAIAAGPADGTLSGFNSATGAVTYTPAAGYQGADSFTFTVKNSGGLTSSAATVTLKVMPGTPTANSQTVSVPFNTAKAITLTGSDPDSPPLTLTYTVQTGPTHGTLSGTSPNLTYTPDSGYHGTDTFTFTVTNGTNTSSAATVMLAVATGTPTANSQSVNVAFNTAKVVALTGSDPDNPALTLTYAIATNPSHGTLSNFNASTGAVTYTPDSGYNSTDSFTFTVGNGTNISAPATVTLNVGTGTPTANPQSVSVAHDSAGTAITLTGSDPNSPPEALTYTIATSPSHGTLSGTAPNLTYMPNSGYHGTDTFTFTVTNTSSLTSSAAIVTLNVATGTPTANAQSVNVPFDGTDTAVTLTGSDDDTPTLTLNYTVGTGPSHGTLSGTAPNLTYKPTSGYHGADSFTFTVSNGTNTSSIATVTLNVGTGTPTANAQSVSVTHDSAGTAITLTGSDPNSPPEALTYTIATNPTHGTLSGTAPNLTYMPNSGYHGTDSFTFTVTNTSGLTSSAATVTLNVATGTPTANAQSVNASENTAANITLTGSDGDTPALALTYSIATSPSHGTLTNFNASTGTATYTPNVGYFGPDSFTFMVSNGTNTSASATVTINVSQVTATITGVSATWGSRTAALTAGSNLLPSGRSTDVSWQGITSFTLTLSQAETLSAGDVSVTGLTVANYGPVTISGSGTSYTLTLAQPINAADVLTLTVGNANIATLTGTLPVLPGDVGDAGNVSASSMVLARNAIGTSNAFADINGDNAVNVTDYNLVRMDIGNTLP